MYKLKLQNSRLATETLRQIIEEEHTDNFFIQEPNTIRSEIAGLTKKLKKLHQKKESVGRLQKLKTIN